MIFGGFSRISEEFRGFTRIFEEFRGLPRLFGAFSRILKDFLDFSRVFENVFQIFSSSSAFVALKTCVNETFGDENYVCQQCENGKSTNQYVLYDFPIAHVEPITPCLGSPLES